MRWLIYSLVTIGAISATINGAFFVALGSWINLAVAVTNILGIVALVVSDRSLARVERIYAGMRP